MGQHVVHWLDQSLAEVIPVERNVFVVALQAPEIGNPIFNEQQQTLACCESRGLFLDRPSRCREGAVFLLLATGEDSHEQLGGLNTLPNFVANTLWLGSLPTIALHSELREKLFDLLDELRVLF